MRLLYTILLYLLTPLVLLRLLWRGFKAPGYWHRWAERFGFFPVVVTQPSIWVHCVSVGETLAAVPLINRLQQQYPGHVLVVTTTTPTGSAQVSMALGNKVLHAYMPYDLPGSVRRFLDRVRPQLVVILETELWPNLFTACNEQQIPLVIVNARLSPRSIRGYTRFATLASQTLRQVSLITAQTRQDADHFLALGAADEQVMVSGNIKFDMNVPPSLEEQAQALRRGWNGGSDGQRPVWVAASTHEGEDEQVLEALRQIHQSLPQLLLVLVPRHPERFDRVAALCRGQGLATVRRSEGTSCKIETAVFVGDTMGELRLFYAAADIAFVGGSLVATGGHNVLEPAMLGRPVIFGPYMFNFTEAAALLLAAKAAVQITDATQLAQTVLHYALDSASRLQAGEKAQQVVDANRGALDVTLAQIARLLPVNSGA
jgi:3-deoxy-D-manno-octulosonic-acid transferase